MMRMVRRGAKFALGATTVGLLGTYAYSCYDVGFRRTVVFWAQAAPIYLHYRYAEWRVKGLPSSVQTEYFDRLHNMYAPKVYDLVIDLRGFFLKCAQMVSVREEIVPPQYLRFLKTLQDNVPPEYTPEEVRIMVEQSLGKKIEEVFAYFDDTPLGAASIGQVHRATLKDGSIVAVKLQFPRAESLFRSDIKILIDFCTMAMPFHVPGLLEVEKQYKTEFDYVKEAENLDLVANNINNVWNEHVVVPRPFMDLCRKNLLVMEYLPGIKLTDGIRRQYSAIAASQGKTLEELENEQKAKIKSGEIKAGPTKFQMKIFIKKHGWIG
eukprot:TRINITY_DN5551_c0_g1_i2.p1 TRINITY_DN5551_c0_g1~~TRINITY_DN5551_c0_g1_i2.p1  ORF type:complete len:323 (-),score=83.13 TRINITY_DN5551_c0_g1_i2:806-1774(-)